mgnify:CR=1 FL=1
MPPCVFLPKSPHSSYALYLDVTRILDVYATVVIYVNVSPLMKFVHGGTQASNKVQFGHCMHLFFIMKVINIYHDK